MQLTTDGHRLYVDAVADAFGSHIDYAMLQKIYGKHPAKPRNSPDFAHVSTSYVERQNLTMQMSMRRFTRLTNAFSKKLENLEHTVALYYMHYNFRRIHRNLRVTPAMGAGVSEHVWSLEEVIALLD